MEWPVHGKIDGPIVMIGFGSIGRGTLPLIERHFTFDKKRFVVVDPLVDSSQILANHGIRHVHKAVTRDNYQALLTQLLTAGGGQGFCVNLSVETSSVEIMRLCREIGALYIDTVTEPWPGFYFDKSLGPEARNQLRPPPGRPRREGEQSRRRHRHLLLRRQSRHGLVVRQAGAGQSCPRLEACRLQGAEGSGPRGLGAAGP